MMEGYRQGWMDRVEERKDENEAKSLTWKLFVTKQ